MLNDWQFFVFGWGVGFTIYALVQLAAVTFVRKSYRAIVAIPAPFMLAVFLWTEYAARKESNLWPVMMIFASPVAAAVVLMLWILTAAMARRLPPPL